VLTQLAGHGSHVSGNANSWHRFDDPGFDSSGTDGVELLVGADLIQQLGLIAGDSAE
jgi:hypothetical protein